MLVVAGGAWRIVVLLIEGGSLRLSVGDIFFQFVKANTKRCEDVFDLSGCCRVHDPLDDLAGVERGAVRNAVRGSILSRFGCRGADRLGGDAALVEPCT